MTFSLNHQNYYILRYTSQWTLLNNRIKAFHISMSLIAKGFEE